MANELTYQGVSVDQAYTSLAAAGIKADAAKSIIGIWIGETIRSGRSFGYSHSFPANEPACVPAPFAREFVHQDWTDGESSVQAGQTPTEQGFNERFHRIERDLDRLGALVAQAFTCMNAMRSTLSGSLGEISAELNRLNGDVAELRRGASAPVPGTVSLGPIGKGPRFVGKTKFFEKVMMVWQDDDGRLITLPDTLSVTLPPTAETRAPKVAEVLGRDADIRKAFTGAINKRDLVERFGDRPSQDGQRLVDLLSTIPDSQTFPSLDAMVTQLGEQDVALLQGIGAAGAVRTSLGAEAGKSAMEASVAQLEGMAPDLSKALQAANVKTLGQLGELSSDKLLEIGRAANIAMTPGNAAALLTRSRVLGRL